MPSSTDTASTRPFSDSAEFQRRVDRTTAEYPARKEEHRRCRRRGIESGTKRSREPKGAAENGGVDFRRIGRWGTDDAFNEASLAASPEARFGLAESSANPRPTAGTPWYMPPEALSQKVWGAHEDVWALGVTMLYVLGKIRLPERTGMGWIIRDLRDGTAESHGRMKKWARFRRTG